MTRDTRLDRRTMLKSTGAAVAATMLAGCSSGGGGDGDSGGDSGGDDGGDAGGTTVTVSPGGALSFDPEEVTVSVGDTVTWDFAAPTHNVDAWPDHHDQISIPDGAEGFGTMAQDGNAFETVEEGETFEHTFETAGEYTYVCTPHAASGMVGTVVVEE